MNNDVENFLANTIIGLIIITLLLFVGLLFKKPPTGSKAEKEYVVAKEKLNWPQLDDDSAKDEPEKNPLVRNYYIIYAVTGKSSIDTERSAKNCLDKIVDNLPKDANFGLLSFANGIEEVVKLGPLPIEQKQRIKDLISGLKPHDVELHESIAKSLRVLTDQARRQSKLGEYNLIILIDDISSQLREIVDSLDFIAKKTLIRNYLIGFNDKFEPIAVNNIAIYIDGLDSQKITQELESITAESKFEPLNYFVDLKND